MEVGGESDNVQAVRNLHDAFVRRDREAWLAMRGPASEAIAAGVWPETDVVRGAEAVWDFYTEVTDTFESGMALNRAELWDAQPDKVLVHHCYDLRGRASGVVVEFDYWTVHSLRDGLVVRDEWFDDRAEAAAAAGLSG